jgi:lipoyl(octanoyl) transferase
MLPSMRWHFFETPPAGGPYNMAIDVALMRRAAHAGDAVFRIYGWSSRTLSLGRNQRARGCYDDAAARRLGVSFVRRPTGGRALLHHREVTYSVTLPAADAAAAARAYDFINEVLLDGLSQLGVRATRAPGGHAMPPGLRPCFDVPAEREIVVGDRKLVGSAQWRRGGALLQHGSILIEDDQALIGQLLLTAGTLNPVAATLTESLGRQPDLADVAGAIRRSLEATIGRSVTTLAAEAMGPAEVDALRRDYADDAWTWRR